MTPQIIHLETRISTTFAVLDAEGNVVARHPVTLEIQKIDTELFSKAVTALQEVRTNLVKQVIQAPLDVETPALKLSGPEQ